MGRRPSSGPGRCAVCLAVPGEVLEIHGDDPLTRSARVSFGGIVKKVNLAYLPDVRVGDHVLVHVGFAIARVDEESAREVFRYLQLLDEIEEMK